jgi:hypothetical protein
LVFLYCADGPYRHVREAVEQGTDWFAWGYRTVQVDPGAVHLLSGGSVAEVWEVDDTRNPRNAMYVMSARLDFVTRTGDYVPMTFWRCKETRSSSNREAVISAAEEGFYVVAARGSSGRAVEQRASSAPAPDRQAVQET